MSQYLIRRLLQMIPLLIGISIIMFALIQTAPGGPEAMFFETGRFINPQIIEILKQYTAENNLKFGLLDRNMQPPSEKWWNVSGNWRLKYVVEQVGCVPEIFCENEGMGREQLTIIVGKDALEITTRAIEIAKRYRKTLKS